MLFEQDRESLSFASHLNLKRKAGDRTEVGRQRRSWSVFIDYSHHFFGIESVVNEHLLF